MSIKKLRAKESKLGLFANGNKKFPPEYVSWMAAKARCYNPKNNRFYCYGAKGIKMCNRWRFSFENFLSDMGKRPKGTSLDRVNNKGNYHHKNCRWAPTIDEAKEKKKILEAFGKKMMLNDWAVFCKSTRGAIEYHLKLGRKFEDIISHLTGPKRRFKDGTRDIRRRNRGFSKREWN